MKLRSVIWTYVVLSILYFTNATFEFQLKQSENLSLQDRKILAVDSTYAKMSIEEKIKLLSINTLSSKNENKLDSTTIVKSNGFLFTENDNISKFEKFNLLNPSKYNEVQFKISYSKPGQIDNMIIGQTNKSSLAKYSQSIMSEKAKKNGINVILGNFFQSYDSYLNNEKTAFTQSPLSSEKYWKSLLEGAEESGIKIGVCDPFMLDIDIDSMRIKDFLAVGLSGNRYYARRGHGIIQLNNNLLDYRNRAPSKNNKSEQTFLRDNFRFDGLIISPDYSNVKIDKQAKLAFESIKSGSDIVCIDILVQKELDSLLTSHFSKHEKELKKICQRILAAKFDIFQNITKKTTHSYHAKEFEYQTKQASLVCIKNTSNLLPIKNLYLKTYFITSIDNNKFLLNQLNHYSSASPYSSNVSKDEGICIVDGFDSQMENALNFSRKYKGKLKLILIVDQITAVKNRVKDLTNFDAILISGDNSELSKEIVIQSIFGAYSISGKLPVYFSPDHPMGSGLELESLNRLAYVSSEYVSVYTSKLDEIDKIAIEGIEAKAFPGCQVMVGVEGKIIYEKSFGHQDYSQKSKVDQQTIYDIASITKIAASTTSLMKLQSDNLFSLDKTLGDYIPELVGNTEFANIVLRDMMAHQAGLTAWIPFYTKTLSNGKPSPNFYTSNRSDEFSVPVAKDLWIKNSYPDTIYRRILSSRLKSKTYVYSDLGYYFVKKIIEKLSKEPLDKFVSDSIYSKLGLQSMTYKPYLKFDLSRIAPTEDDKDFRKQVIKGYVHDPGAAMLGGVGGHAGIFSTANDLAILMQMMLNDGIYGGKQIIKKEVLNEYTSVQFPNSNRRGAGFDKPTLNGTEATACALASPLSFGHSGFTGTLTWADPKYKINYVFLSNRVYPNAENWKIVKMDIRTRIQTKIYEAVQSASSYNFLK